MQLKYMGTSYNHSSLFEANLYLSLIIYETKPRPLLNHKYLYSSSLFYFIGYSDLMTYIWLTKPIYIDEIAMGLLTW